MAIFLEQCKVSKDDLTFAKSEVKIRHKHNSTNENYSHGESFLSFFEYFSDDIPQEIIEKETYLSSLLGDVKSDTNSIKHVSESEVPVGKMKRLSKRPYKDKDYVSWNEVNTKKLRKDRNSTDSGSESETFLQMEDLFDGFTNKSKSHKIKKQ